jgi:predicted RNase H-like nuclease (RuvC/YqgF family)
MSDNCQAERQEIASLRREVARLERENRRLQRQLARKQRAIRSTYDFAQAHRAKAARTLRQRSGVPRGEWGFSRGADKVANGAMQRLRGEL